MRAGFTRVFKRPLRPRSLGLYTRNVHLITVPSIEQTIEASVGQKPIKLRDAFGVGREMPLNYVERQEVDNKLIESLTRDKHVVIYGSSK